MKWLAGIAQHRKTDCAHDKFGHQNEEMEVCDL